MNKLPVAGFVLAGGKSSRMGRDKALLEFEGQLLVERALDKLKVVCMEVAIAGGVEDLWRFGAMVPDRWIGCGPLGGLAAALEASSFDWNLVLAVDVPLVPVELVRALGERCVRSSAVGVMLRVDGRVEPLCAGYHRRALPAVQAALRAERFKVITAVEAAGPIEYFDIEGKNAGWFANVNTPEELAAAMRLVERDCI